MFTHAVRRDRCCKQITLACPCSVSATLGLPPLTAHVPSLSTLLRLYVAPLGTIRGQPWAACTSQFYAAQVQALRKSSEAQTQLGLHFVPFPGPRSSGDEVFGECGRCDLSPSLSLPLSFLGVQPVQLLRWMLTIQNPKKSWLAMKPLTVW